MTITAIDVGLVSAHEALVAFYVDALTSDGWTAGESRTEVANDTTAEIVPFTRGEEELEMAIAVTNGQTLVAFTLPQEE